MPNRSRLCCVAVGVLSVGAFVAAAPAGAETLTEALAAAYQSNPDLVSARATLRGRDEGVPQAFADFLPKINGSVGGTNTMMNDTASNTAPGVDGSVPSNPRMTEKSLTLGLDTSLNLYRGGQSTAQMRYAEATMMASRASLATTEQQVMMDTTRAYVGILASTARLDAAVQSVQTLEDIKKQVDELYGHQRATITEVATVDAELAQARAQREQARGDLEVIQSEYNATVGAYPTNITEWPKLPPLPASVAEAQKLAEQYNPRIKAAEYTLEGNEASLDQARGTFLPTLDLDVNYARTFDDNWQRNTGSFYTPDGAAIASYRTKDYQSNITVTLRLTVPLYDGGGRSSQVRQQHEAISASQAQITQAERSVSHGVTSNWDLVNAAKARLIMNDTNIAAAKLALDGTRYQFNNGHATLREVLLARQKYTESQVAKLQSQYDLLVASSRLLADTGQYDAKALALPVEIYDPVAHYQDVRFRPW